MRFASAHYSLPSAWEGKKVKVAVVDEEVVISYDGREIVCHPLMAPGGISIIDEQYSVGAQRPLRPVPVKTATERAFLAFGPLAEAFLRAAAAGTTRLVADLGDIVTPEASWGRQPLLDALERGVRFRRLRGSSVGVNWMPNRSSIRINQDLSVGTRALGLVGMKKGAAELG